MLSVRRANNPHPVTPGELGHPGDRAVDALQAVGIGRGACRARVGLVISGYLRCLLDREAAEHSGSNQASDPDR